MTEPEKLLNCPFCGGKAKMDIHQKWNACNIYCTSKHCPASINDTYHYDYENGFCGDDAIQAWNTRPREPINEEAVLKVIYSELKNCAMENLKLFEDLNHKDVVRIAKAICARFHFQNRIRIKEPHDQT